MKLFFSEKECNPGTHLFSLFLESDKRFTEFSSEFYAECNRSLNKPFVKHFIDTFFLLAMYHKKVLLKPNYLISILLYFEICHKCLFSQGYGVLFVFVLVGWLVG